MMEELIVLMVCIVVTFVIGNMLGWAIHWIMHHGSMPRLSRAHDSHHTLYTPADFLSTSYRSAGKDDSAFVFVPIIFIAVLMIVAIAWALTGAWWVCASIIVFGSIVGWLNSYIHAAFHIKDHFLYRFRMFREMSRLHVLHHIEPSKNMGIFWFGIDRLFGTFIDR